MIAWGAVVVASLAGSLHCVGMCGPFVAVASGADAGARSPWLLQGLYAAGRLTTYLVVGTIAGATGQALDLAGAHLGVSRIAALAAGAVMIVAGLLGLATALGTRSPAPRPAPWSRAITRALQPLRRRSAPVRAYAVGALTTLLPCGWLYAFVAAAAGTGSPLGGAFLMLAFWLGTVPALVAVGLGIRHAGGWLSRRAPLVVSVLLVAIGLWGILARLAVPHGAHPMPH